MLVMEAKEMIDVELGFRCHCNDDSMG